MNPATSILQHARQFYVNGAWIDPVAAESAAIVNPATEQAIGVLALGTSRDVETAVGAARAAFDMYSHGRVKDRQSLLSRIADGLEARSDELAYLLSLEMGAPLWRARNYQVPVAVTHLREIVRVLDHYRFEDARRQALVLREPIGVCALITPWNAPIMQIVSKVAPALAAGCTMVLKPSEEAPLSAVLLAEVMHDCHVPAGVFNLVHGVGAVVGDALSRHAEVDLVSFTGSTRAGVLVAQTAAPTVKRVHQELGGKSANILLDDVDIDTAVSKGVLSCFGNSGQSCIAPDRMLVPNRLYERAADVARRTAEAVVIGDPLRTDTAMGPLVNQAQFDKVQRLIQIGLDEGARVLVGGKGKPPGCDRGYFVRPTVFAEVTHGMRIAHEEIFGPVLSLMRYETEDEAIRIANGTEYGLAAYVQSSDVARAQRIARKLRAGYVYANYALPDYSAPFGGYKRSGNGREYGEWGMEAFLELKSIVGT